jgi:hypothetical protein
LRLIIAVADVNGDLADGDVRASKVTAERPSLHEAASERQTSAELERRQVGIAAAPSVKTGAPGGTESV